MQIQIMYNIKVSLEQHNRLHVAALLWPRPTTEELFKLDLLETLPDNRRDPTMPPLERVVEWLLLLLPLIQETTIKEDKKKKRTKQDN